ncbi:MAG: hypothetical protein MSIBF_04695 [Candidatus Altiarchaeales archaeon IMC4]|nr:MAG: hypothetical protein MSIBF_04695 [Candidatus Altiarchaeales archaeon IMC4]
MDNKQKMAALAALGILMLMTVGMVSAQQSAADVVNCIICRLLNVLYSIAAGVALIIIVLAGIKWTASGDDPGARKSAKESVIHAILGLVIVLVAYAVIDWAVGGTSGGGFEINLPFSSSCGDVCN